MRPLGTEAGTVTAEVGMGMEVTAVVAVEGGEQVGGGVGRKYIVWYIGKVKKVGCNSRTVKVS